jgi:plasmid stabilization system protein ParE
VPKTYRVFLSRHAQRDVAEIYDYISVDSQENAAAFVLTIEEKVATLANMPDRAPLIPENALLGTSYRHLVHGKYRIIFRIQGYSVMILRIIHGARLLQL